MPDVNLLSKYIGIPYVHQGRTLAGLDCWGLIIAIYKDLGFELRDLNDYELQGHLNGKDYFKPYEFDEWERFDVAKPYDCALFVDPQGIACHAGVITPDYRMIHASKQLGVAVTSLKVVFRLMKLDSYYHLKARDGNNKI